MTLIKADKVMRSKYIHFLKVLVGPDENEVPWVIIIPATLLVKFVMQRNTMAGIHLQNNTSRRYKDKLH